jgi:hypothetical protein
MRRPAVGEVRGAQEEAPAPAVSGRSTCPDTFQTGVADLLNAISAKRQTLMLTKAEKAKQIEAIASKDA